MSTSKLVSIAEYPWTLSVSLTEQYVSQYQVMTFFDSGPGCQIWRSQGIRRHEGNIHQATKADQSYGSDVKSQTVINVTISDIVFSSAMCSSRDEAIIKETFGFMSAEARDQDVFMFFGNLAANRSARRLLAEFMKHNYESVRVLCSLTHSAHTPDACRYTNAFRGIRCYPSLSRSVDSSPSLYDLSHTVVKSSFAQFTTERDATDVEDFFKVIALHSLRPPV